MQVVTSGNGTSYLVKKLALCLLMLHADSPSPAMASQPPIVEYTRFYILFDQPTATGTATTVYMANWLHALISDLLMKVQGGLETLGHIQGEHITGSMSFSLLGGTFLGALLFGYPYRGIGIPDLAALAVLGFVLVYVFLSKTRAGRRRKSNDRFSAGPGDVLPPGVSQDPDFRKKTGANSSNTGGKFSGKRDDPATLWGSSRPGEGGSGQNRGSGLPNRDLSGPDGKKIQLPGLSGRGGISAESPGTRVRSKPEPAAPSFPRAVNTVPADGFDTGAFLEGARTLYIRLQDAWASRDVEGLSPFMTPDMMRMLREQAKADPHPVKVDILQIAANVIHVEQTETQEWVEVAFAVLMSTGGLAPVTVNELWHFARDRSKNGTWRLAGIEPDGE